MCLLTYCGWKKSISHHRSEILVSDDSPVNTKQMFWFPLVSPGFSMVRNGFRNHPRFFFRLVCLKLDGTGFPFGSIH